MKKAITLFMFLLTGITGFTQSARVQVVHNCADAMAAQVDVYVNGLLQLSDVPFRTASPFTDLPAGVSLLVSIAPGDSSSVLDAFYNETFNLTEGETYIIVADGIVSMSGYNPSPPFSLEVYEMARESASNPNMIDVLVHQGATDLPLVDVYETGQGLGLVLEDVSYPDFDGYLEFPVANYVVQLNEQSGQPIAAFVAPLEAFGLEGEAITVLGSGFLDPSQNSNGPAFGLFAAPAVGGPLVPLPPSPILAVNDFNNTVVWIYPNPTYDFINIRGDEAERLSFVIYDLNGRIISEMPKLDELHRIDVSGLSSGVYILSVSDENNSLYSVKFIKK